jgi:hypothetical protein
MSVSCDANKFNASSVYYLSKDAPIGPDITTNNLIVNGTATINGVTEINNDLTVNSNIICDLTPTQLIQLSLAGDPPKPSVLFTDDTRTAGILFNGTANTLVIGGGSNPAVNVLSDLGVAGNLLATSLGGAFAGTTTGIDINGSLPINQQTINMVIGNTLIQGGLHVTSPVPSAIIGNITFARPYSAPPVILVSALNQQIGSTPIKDYANWGIANLIPLTVGFQLLGTNNPANGLATWLCIGPV